jgi:hypothetical protein
MKTDLERAKLFIEDVKKACKKHGLSISHEDGWGAFIIETYLESNIEWLEGAKIEI